MNRLYSESVADCELASAIEACSQLQRFTKGRVLFRQGQAPDRLYLLEAGEVVLTCRLANKSVGGYRAIPGSLLGLPAIAGSQPYSMSAMVTRNSTFHVISLASFRQIVGSNPRLSFRALEILAAEVTAARWLICRALSRKRPVHTPF